MAYLTEKVDSDTIYKKEGGMLNSKGRQFAATSASNFLGLKHKENWDAVRDEAGGLDKQVSYSHILLIFNRQEDLALRGDKQTATNIKDKKMNQRTVLLTISPSCFDSCTKNISVKQNFTLGGWTGSSTGTN
jgi:hypothetical protein